MKLKKGTIKFIHLELGFWGIIDEDGNQYYPINLTDNWKEEGVAIKFEFKVLKNIMTTNMWGSPIEIINIIGV